MVVRPYNKAEVKTLSFDDIINCISEGSHNKMWDKVRFFSGARDIVIIFNDTCKSDNLPLNRVFINNDGKLVDTLEGTFVIVKHDYGNESYESLKPEQIDKLSEIFDDWTKPVNIMSFGQDPNYDLFELFINKMYKN